MSKSLLLLAFGAGSVHGEASSDFLHVSYCPQALLNGRLPVAHPVDDWLPRDAVGSTTVRSWLQHRHGIMAEDGRAFPLLLVPWRIASLVLAGSWSTLGALSTWFTTTRLWPLG